MRNHMTVRFDALSQNESFARVVVGAFATQLNPTVSELADIKTAVSEAVTNAIIHGYRNHEGQVELAAELFESGIDITVRDEGRGIDDVERAREPFYTTCAGDDRSGMGFTVMETFMDQLEVQSIRGEGTKVWMRKHIGGVDVNDPVKE